MIDSENIEVYEGYVYNLETNTLTLEEGDMYYEGWGDVFEGVATFFLTVLLIFLLAGGPLFIWYLFKYFVNRNFTIQNQGQYMIVVAIIQALIVFITITAAFFPSALEEYIMGLMVIGVVLFNVAGFAVWFIFNKSQKDGIPLTHIMVPFIISSVVNVIIYVVAIALGSI